jgi:CpXC protein
MSLFKVVEVSCPVCDTVSAFDMVHSVNADRRPDLREEILNHTFQRIICPGCAGFYRIEPEFTFMHLAKGEFLAVWPASDVDHWADAERRSKAAFDSAYGPNASKTAAEIGQELNPRIAFGWQAAREKLVIRDLGFDDHTIELGKIALLRTQDGLPVGRRNALRFNGIDDEGNLIFGLFPIDEIVPTEEIRVPRSLLDEINADPEWQPLRDQLGAGLFVDMLRLIIEPMATTPAAG